MAETISSAPAADSVALPGRQASASLSRSLWIGVTAVAAIMAVHMLIRWTVGDAHRSEAEKAALGWIAIVTKTSLGTDLMAAKPGPVPSELAPLAETMRSQQIIRIKLFDTDGQLLLSTDGVEIWTATPLDQPNVKAAMAASTGSTFVQSYAEVSRPGLPSYFSEAYAPYWRNGKVVAVLEIYVDQSASAAKHQQRAAYLSLAIALIVMATIALPAVLIFRKSQAILRAERDRETNDARFAATVESIPHGFVMFDRNDNLIVCNERYRRMYGLPVHACAPGTPLRDIIRRGIESGLLRESLASTQAYTVSVSTPDAVTRRTWDLKDGRIISVTASGMTDGGRVSIHADITEQHRTAERIAENEARFRDYASSAADWCWETDAQHRMAFLTDAFQTTMGLDPAHVIGERIDKAATHPDDMELLSSLVECMNKRQPFRDLCVRALAANGNYVTIASTGAPRFASDGTFLGYRGTARDVTRQHEHFAQLEIAERELRKRTQLLEEAQRLGKLGNVTYTFGSKHAEWSAEIYGILRVEPNGGLMPVEYIKQRCLDGGGARLDAAMRLVKETRTTQSVDLKVRRDDRTIVHCAVTIKGLFDEAGQHIGFRAALQDISERKQAVEQLEQLAFYDQLTKLPNRALFTRELDALLASDQRDQAALLLLDLDNFKDVNDSLGHASGDELLSKVSAMIASRLRSDHLLARLGGDEFAIIMRRSRGLSDVAALAASIIDSITGSILLSNGEVNVGTSIGIAFADAESSAPDLFRKADLALYKAKASGRERFEFFRPEMDEALRHKMRLERDLKRAVAEDLGLSAHYQAQVDLRGGEVIGFEALTRWTHPELGPISPSEFIPIAENSGLIIDIGRWILRNAAAQMRRWIDAGHPPREISVNVSAAQLWHGSLVEDVTQVLQATGLPPHLLCLELTESLLANPSEHRLRSEISRLKELGVRLALDDFGTDYSSLGYLTQLPFDHLKIDRIFVEGVAQSDRRRELLKGIVALGHGLGMSVVGEGAETPEEIEVLALLGCDVAQGYVLARPLPPQEALEAATNFVLPKRTNGVHALQHRLTSDAR